MASSGRIRVWDLPTRLFHWLLAGSVGLAWWTGDSPRWTAVHVLAGTVVAGLLVFRLVWGLIGGRWSRWRSWPLWPPPWRRPRDDGAPGHTPLASWSAVTVLVLLGLAVVTGAVVLAGEEQQGLLAGWFSVGQGIAAHAVHELAAWAVLAWLLVHLAGVAKQSVAERQSLVRGMVDGRKRAPDALGDVPLHLLPGLGLLALVVGLGIGAEPAAPVALPQDATWASACGDCHLPFHPSLLPARSWERMLDEQDEHFGEGLYLDDDTVWALRSWAVAHAAEAEATEHAWRIARAVPPGQAPLAVTETSSWQEAHASLSDADFAHPDVRRRSRCDACHGDAEAGTFDGRAISVPPPSDPQTARLR